MDGSDLSKVLGKAGHAMDPEEYGDASCRGAARQIAVRRKSSDVPIRSAQRPRACHVCAGKARSWLVVSTERCFVLVHLLDRRLVTFGLLAPVIASCGGSQAAGPLPDDMALGDPHAKVTVVEYASVACPVCGRWYKDNFAAFKTKYIDSGKIRFIYREMLVGGGAEVTTAAAGFLLARCAGEKRYFDIVDAIYASQPELFDDPKGVLQKIASARGFSEDQFNACVQNPEALKALSARVDANAKKDDIHATPTFVINGKALDAGYHPLSDLDAAIAAAAKG
jgi:protein-disulfide isomerase